MSYLFVVKTIIFIILLFGASIQDIINREINNWIPVLMFITAFVGFDRNSFLYMLFGMVITSLPLLIAALIKTDSIGGADIKVMAASGFMLGAQKGIAALIVGMLLAVVCTALYRYIKHNDIKKSFPLVPYLAIGAIITQIINK